MDYLGRCKMPGGELCVLLIQSSEKGESRTPPFTHRLDLLGTTVVILNWAFSVNIFFA